MGRRHHRNMTSQCIALVAIFVAATFAAPVTNGPLLKNWESHGELTENLHLPAVTDDLIASIKATNPEWEAGHNDLFVNATLAQAKVLMGTLQNTDQSTWLPYEAITL